MTIDPTQPNQLTWRGVQVRLTPSQCALLILLARHAGKVVSFDHIYHHLYTTHGEIVEPAMVNWHKHTLQKWVRTTSGQALPLRWLPRRGYVLDLDPAKILILPEVPNAIPTG